VTIVHHGETSPTIDTDLFPNTRYVSKQGYWTSDINYDGVTAWVVDFSDGDVTLTSMESSSVGIYRSIRLVVGEE
ncbi:Lcl domain-containing protein, partial [Gilvimarinus sp. 1_MG-2023]|uniref:Lcl domain-containing protein n=1 Tax=Gilvimarinus sp. 1_MG-2023 TaxID=3062638 RepID=UPI0026E1E204